MREEEIQHIKQQFGIIGNAQALNRAVEIAVQVAPTAMTVLITGESGSGKESFSKLIHSLSPYKHGQFIAINCGAIPEGTIDSELFGHKKGAFTGAAEERKGYFEEANEGTIFLDEIAELPLSTQARLLRVLEYGEFIKVGASKVQKVSLRVLAATNVDLLEAVYKGKFREDLYYRLTTVPLRIPPLRERGMDAVFLFRKFATDFADKYHVKPLQLTQEAQKTLLAYHFPGNIRQLKNLVEQLSALEMDRYIEQATLVKYLPPLRAELPVLAQRGSTNEILQERDILYKILFDMKKDVSELKRLVFELLSTDASGHQRIKEHAMLFQSLTPSAATPVQVIAQPSQVEKVHAYDKLKTVEEENLSIVDKERILIGKALKKHRNKRKEAAKSLGISERTLYRKIKQHDLDQA
ncbi:MAG: sigma 54-interacting transcriptional regulator [Bacteroidota bacterium]